MADVPAFAYPRNADEWWTQAAYVRAVMPEWGPTNETCDSTLARSRHLMTPAYATLLESFLGVSFYEMLDKLITERDTRAWLVFQTVWEDAPDAPYIHWWTGWGRLCDLCSEVQCIMKPSAS